MSQQILSALQNGLQRIRAKSDHLLKQSRDCSPKGGLAIGSDYVRYFIRGEALAIFLREVWQTKKYNVAYEIARKWSIEAVRLHNSRREWQAHIWDETAIADLDDAVRILKAAMQK